MRKALFFPSYLGGGFGHIGRCLALASALEAQGWATGLALAGPHLRRVRPGAPPTRQVFELRRPYRPQPDGRPGPAFTVIADFSYQLVRDGYHRPEVIRACVAEQLGVIRRFRPDVLVADVWPLAGILAHKTGLPLVQVVRAGLHPAAPGLIWWQPRPAGLVSPDPRPVFNPLLEAWGLTPIDRAEDLLRGDLYLVPSFPELDPLPAGLEATEYVGPLLRPGVEARADSAAHRAPLAGAGPELNRWLAGLDPSLPLVYISSGGGAGSVWGPALYRLLLTAVQDLGIQALVSTGTRVAPQDLPAPGPRLLVQSWTPGPEAIAISDLVVFPGGYGTSMEMVRAGKPGLVIPAHTEQESNGRRLEAAGGSHVVLPASSPPVPVSHRWPAGEFTTLVMPDLDLAPARLSQALSAALEDGELKVGARRLQQAAAALPGARLAAERVIRAAGAVRPVEPAQSWLHRLKARWI